MEAVTAAGPSQAWAFGALSLTGSDNYTGFVRHWTGATWRPVSLPGAVTRALSGFPSTVAASSARSNVWAFTGEGAWVRWNGRKWSAGELPKEKPGDDGIILAASVLSPRDVWAFGYYNPVSPLPYIAHYNGHHWKLTNLYLNTAIVAASAVSRNDIWAVGTDNTNVLLHWNGKSWNNERLPGAVAGRAYFEGVVALSRTSVWITGDVVPTASTKGTVQPGALHWTEHGLKSYPLNAPAPLLNATADGHGGFWAVAQEPGAVTHFTAELWHFSGGSWQHGGLPGADANDFVDAFAAIPGTRSVWAAGLFRSAGLDRAAIMLHGPRPR